MNPALPILAVLSLSGLAISRKGAGRAWCLVGLAGILLLSPALSIPDGVPSPAAALGSVAPWQGISNPELGNPNLVDVTFQIQPWLLYLRHELRDGRLPFWNPYQFSGEPFWSNGQGAPLFPLHLLFAFLPVQLGLVLLPWLRIVLGGVGAYCLARSLSVDDEPALVAAVVYPLSGMVTGFVLYPMGNALALVPWVLWSVEGLTQGRSGWKLLAVLSGLQLLAGHPETPVFVGILSALYLVVRLGIRSWRIWARFALGWAVGLGLAAIQLIPLAWTLVESSRWLEPGSADPVPLAVKGALLLRLVLPQAFGVPALGTWWGPFNDVATAIYAGAMTIPLAILGLTRVKTDRRWAAVLFLLLFSLGSAYHLPIFREVLLGLPILSHALHHYLKFAVELCLALLAAAGTGLLVRGESRRVLVAGCAVLAALLGLGWLAFFPDWSQRQQLSSQAAWTGWAVAGCVVLWLFSALGSDWRRRLLLLIPLVLALDLVTAHRPVNPALSARALFPMTPAVELLQASPGRVAALGSALRPNAAMVYRLRDIRGDSPVKNHRYQELYGRIAASDPVFVQPIRQWQSPILDTLGVRWVLAAPGEDPPDPSWNLVYEGEDARVFERETALPLVRWNPERPGSDLSPTQLGPGAWSISWSSDTRAEVVLAEVWDRGWRAQDGSREVTVEIAESCLMGLEVGPGAGRLELRYRPRGFRIGTLLGVLALGALLPRRRTLFTRPEAATRDSPAP